MFGSHRPIVIGAPRSGFSLLIQLVSRLRRRAGVGLETDPQHRLLTATVDGLSPLVTARMIGAFADRGVGREELLYNGEFHLMVGGVKWIDRGDPGRCVVRKYFGVRDRGDFLLTMSHPKIVLDYYPIVHSHASPRRWTEDPDASGSTLLTSIRNPAGIVNSAVFSINALTSEYLQRFCPEVDQTEIRDRLARYKLTDLRVVRGLVRYLCAYMDEFLEVLPRYRALRWEELVTDPPAAIVGLADRLGMDLSREQAAEVWAPMDHRNLLTHHRHNYREGKGVVGDFLEHLTQHHLDVFREAGFDRYCERLGYPPLPELDPDRYSPFQREVAAYLDRDEVFRDVGDPNVFTFAFNKSNIDAQAFGFRTFEPLRYAHVERSTFDDDAVVTHVCEVAESICEDIDPVLAAVEASRVGGTREGGDVARFVVAELQRLTRAWGVGGSGRTEGRARAEGVLAALSTTGARREDSAPC